MKLSSVLTVSAYVSAITIVSAAAWTAGEYTEMRPVILKEYKLAQTQTAGSQKEMLEQIQMSQQIQQLQRYQFLDMKRKLDTLSMDEIMERCKIAQVLGYPLAIVGGCQ